MGQTAPPAPHSTPENPASQVWSSGMILAGTSVTKTRKWGGKITFGCFSAYPIEEKDRRRNSQWYFPCLFFRNRLTKV
jgi:hypothetical protein